jgi:hypothetical protein
MKRHPTDTLSLVFGVIFLGIVGLWFVGLFVDIDIPHLGWIAAIGLIVLGLLGVAASLRGGDRDAAPTAIDDTEARWREYEAAGAGAGATDTTDSTSGTTGTTGTTGPTGSEPETRDTDSLHVGPDDRPDWGTPGR